MGATVDEDLAVSTCEGDRLRTRDYRRVVELGATKGLLKKGLKLPTLLCGDSSAGDPRPTRREPVASRGCCEDAATDILVAMLSPTFYMELVKGRGWGDERAVGWLADTRHDASAVWANYCRAAGDGARP